MKSAKPAKGATKATKTCEKDGFRETRGVVLGGSRRPEDLLIPRGMEWANEQFHENRQKHERLRVSPPEHVVHNARFVAEAVFQAAIEERAEVPNAEKILECRVFCMRRLADLGADAFADGELGGGKDAADTFRRWLDQAAEPVRTLGYADSAEEVAGLFWQLHDATPPKRSKKAPRTPRRLHALAYEMVSIVQERCKRPGGEPYTLVRGDPSMGPDDPSVFSFVAPMLNSAGVRWPIPEDKELTPRRVTPRNVEEWYRGHGKLLKPNARRKPRNPKPGRRLKLE